MDGYVVIEAELKTKSFDAQIDYIEQQLEEIEYKLKQADMGFEVGDTAKLEAQYEKLNNQLSKLKQKQAELNRSDLTNIQKSIEKVGDSTTKVINKVSKWALAIFGVRSAYMFVRQSASTLAQYNEKIASDLEYIRYAMASALQPIIERLIQLAYKLLTYVNYIAKAWFGVDLFANSSANAMNKASKSAEKMKKSLAGFDEMNVLNDNGTTGAMGAMPSLDLSEVDNVNLDKTWVGWIAKKKNAVISGLLGIAGAITALKLSNFAKNLGLVNKQFTILQGLGVGLIIYGIIKLILDLIEYYKELDSSLENNGTSWKKFGSIITSIGVIIAGVALAIASLPVAIAGAIVLILGLIASAWDSIKKIWSNGSDWLNQKIEWLSNRGSIILTSLLTFIHDTIDGAIEIFDGLFVGVKQILDGILMLFKGDFKNGMINIGKGIVNILIGALNGLISGLNAVISPIRSLIVAVGKVMGKSWTMSNIKIPKIPKLAVGGVVNMPGRGINYGGANIGERGAEGVIPLTNSQMMAQLGEAIGKYVNINATVPVYVGNRQIAREIKKISADNDFAFNR